MDDQGPTERHDPRVLALKAGLLALWVLVAFGGAYCAPYLQFNVAGWPFAYWFLAQGALLAFIAIVVAYAWAMKRLVPEDAVPTTGEARGDHA